MCHLHIQINNQYVTQYISKDTKEETFNEILWRNKISRVFAFSPFCTVVDFTKIYTFRQFL